jgi:membrane protein implicated in regulation of membrane protease activity
VIALMITMTAMPLMLGAVALHHGAHHLAVHFFAAFVFAPLLLLLLLLLHMLGVLFRRMLRMVDGGSRRCLGCGNGHSYEYTGH